MIDLQGSVLPFLDKPSFQTFDYFTLVKEEELEPFPVIKIGSRAKYRLSDLMKYIEERTEK